MPVTLPSMISPTYKAQLLYPFSESFKWFRIYTVAGVGSGRKPRPPVPLFAADVNPDALIRLGIPLFTGNALNDGIFAVVQRALQLLILGELAAQLRLYPGQFLFFGRDAHLAAHKAVKQRSAQQHPGQRQQPPGESVFPFHRLAAPPYAGFKALIQRLLYNIFWFVCNIFFLFVTF